jgi:hypothetical protein
MVDFNKETMMIAAVIVALIATVYMYKELQKTKQDVEAVRTASTGFTNQISTLARALANDVSKPQEEEVVVEKKKVL